MRGAPEGRRVAVSGAQQDLSNVVAALAGVRGPDANGWYTALCPFHDDLRRPNLRLSERGFSCMACGEKGNLRALASRLDVAIPASSRTPFEYRIVGEYDYKDEDGKLLFQVVRLFPKEFRQRRPDGASGWIWKLGSTRRVLYRLPELLAARPDETVFVVEGEKDVERLLGLDLVATTNPQGAGKWRDEYATPLHGHRVAILPDNDDAGRKHGHQVARSVEGVAAEVKVLDLPDLQERGDVSDWLAADGDVEKLNRLVADEPVWTPDSLADTNSSKDAKVIKLIGSAPSQATMMVELANETELFHTPDNEPVVSLEINGHRETWPVRSTGFRRWIAREFHKREGKAPSGSAIADAISVIEGQALFEGSKRSLWTRIAQGSDGEIYVDMGTPSWDAIRVTREGWDLVAEPSVHFRRGQATAALPTPERGGSVSELRPLINLATEDDFVRVIGFLVSCFRPRGPHGVLAFVSEQGSGKTAAARVVRSLVDPSAVPLRAMPRDERDLAITARANHVLALDNVSSVRHWLSDALCRTASGAGWTTRRLYTDADEEIFSHARPVIMTGIEDYVTAGDLLDRTILVNLPTIPPSARRREEELLQEYELMRGRIFGALLDAVSMALQNSSKVRLPELPRMADLVAWVTASEDALPWPQGEFLRAYVEGATCASDIILEASPIAEPVRLLAESSSAAWEGTATELLAELGARADDRVQRQRMWPKSPQVLSGLLTRIKPTLRATGVDIEFARERNRRRRRLIRISSDKTVHIVQSVQAELEMLDNLTSSVDGHASKVDDAAGPASSALESAVGDVDDVDDGIPAASWEETVP